MKLTVHNFGCYSDKSFNFKDRFVLFQGPNGSGKSTVFKAICYALFGKNKTLKYGESSMWVRFETKDWSVKRVSKPMSLVVTHGGKSYESVKAQAVIEDTLIGMCWEQFCLCTWVGSTSKASLATITPTDRYNVVRTMVANTEETRGDCEKISQYEKDTKDDQLKVKSQQSTLENIYNDLSGMKAPDVKEVPKNLNAKIQKLEKEIAVCEKKLRDINQAKNKMSRRDVKQRLKDIQLRPQIVDKIAVMKKYLVYAKKVEQQNLDAQEFEDAKERYFKSVKRDLDNRKVYVDSVDEKTLKIKIQESTVRAIAKDNGNPYWDHDCKDIKKRLSNASKAKVTAEMKDTKQPCPRCKADVCIDGGSVVKYLKSYDKAKVSTSQDDVDFLEALSELKYDYDEDCEAEYEEYTQAKLRVKECQRILEKNVLTAELNRRNKSIGSLVKKPNGYKDKYDVVYLEDRISALTEQLGGIEDPDDDEEDRLRDLLDQETVSVSEDYDDVDQTLKDLRRKLAHLRKSEGAQLAIEQWKEIQAKVETVTKNLSKCRKAQETIGSTMEAIAILKTKQREAEILSMQNVIDTINVLSASYLEKLFDEPISVSITMIKRTRNNTKMSLEISALYRGHKYSDMGDFSQGEIIKINLAFILALNQLNDSPFLLLDEIMVNIDHEIISEIYSILRDISGDRPIFVIDHNAVKGVFDRIIEFGD